MHINGQVNISTIPHSFTPQQFPYLSLSTALILSLTYTHTHTHLLSLLLRSNKTELGETKHDC
jgi:hypothetical protein